MDVRCERCGTEYEFDDALVSDKGTTVKCMSCGHQFRVQRPSALKAPDKWLVRRPNGEELVFVSLRELQRAIAAHQVGKEDQLFRGALRARSLGSIPELQPFFERAGKPPQKSTSRGLGLPPPPAAPLPSMGLTQPFSLANSGNPTPATLRPPGALPPMTEPIPPVTPPSPMTPLPPPVAIAGPRASVPPPVVHPSAPTTPAIGRSAPPPALPAPNQAKSAPPPTAATVKSAPPPIAAVKSAPPPAAVVTKRPPPPTNREIAATEPLPPITAPIPEDPPTTPFTEPAEAARPQKRAPSDPPARATSERAPARRRSVPPEPDEEEPRRRDPGMLRWVVAGSILGLTALLAGTLGRQYIAKLSPTAGSAGGPSGAPLSTASTPAPTTSAAATTTTAAPTTSATGQEARSPALLELVRNAEKSLKDGDLEGAKEALVRANAMAPKDAGVLLDLATVATTKADVAWLRLRLLPKTATDARRLASTELSDAGKRAKSAAEAASASSPESLETLQARVDALRLTDDVAGAQKLSGKLATEPVRPGAALALAALDLAGEAIPSPQTLERLRVASEADGGAGRARGLYVYALTRVGDPASATKELDKLAALSRPYPLLTELRALVAATKQTAPLPVAGVAATDAVPIGKLPAVVPVAKPDTDFKINDTPTPPKPEGDGPTPTPTPTADPTPKPPPPRPTKETKGEFSEEELHKKLFGDQPK
jgi:predicted Zn finger-like uncharacterized protein